MSRKPAPPFSEQSAVEKVRLAENVWNTRDPARVALSFTTDSHWRSRAEFLTDRGQIEAFLRRKWDREHDHRLAEELWAFGDDRIAVRFACEYRDDSGTFYRAHVNENWEFDGEGLMRRRLASISERPIAKRNRAFDWPLGPRPMEHPALNAMGF